jgi:hypothetical protein
MAINHKITIVNSSLYLVAGDDEIIMVDNFGPTTVILPSDDISKSKGRVLYIKDYSGKAKTNLITIMSSGKKTIDGVSSMTLDNGYAYMQVVYDGTNWKIISQSTSNKKNKIKDYLKIFFKFFQLGNNK